MAIEVGDQVLIWDEEELDQLPPGLYDEIWSNLVWAVRIRSNGSNYVDLVKFEPRALERIA